MPQNLPMFPKYFLCLLLTISVTNLALSQNPMLAPVNFMTGHVNVFAADSQDPEALRKAKVRAITIARVETSLEETEFEKTDTQHVYKEIFTKEGDQIPYHAEFRDFGGFNRIDYNSNGTMAHKQWKGLQILGCGTGGITEVWQEHHTLYQYHKKQLILTINSTRSQGGRWHDSIPVQGLHEAFFYNKKGLKTVEETYFLPDSTGQDTMKTVRHFCYDKKGRLSLEFLHESYFSPPRRVMDSLVASSPANLATILLRQSFQWRDTIRQQDFPEGKNDTDEEQERREAALEQRDSADDAQMDFYEDDKNRFLQCIGYNYDDQDNLVAKLHFKGTDLSRKDSFAYDAKHRLVYWELWHLDYDDDYSDWEPTEYSPLPLHAIWTFEYDERDRVKTATLLHLASSAPSFTDPAFHFRKEEEVSYTFQYDAAGKVISALDQGTYYHYDLNPDFMPPVTHETETFLVQYDLW